MNLLNNEDYMKTLKQGVTQSMITIKKQRISKVGDRVKELEEELAREKKKEKLVIRQTTKIKEVEVEKIK